VLNLTYYNGALLIEINPEKTMMSGEMDVSIRETSSAVLPELLGVFEG